MLVIVGTLAVFVREAAATAVLTVLVIICLGEVYYRRYWRGAS